MRVIIFVVLCFSVSFSFIALGDDDDHEWALDAVRAGKAIPLARIIGSIEDTYDATVYEVYIMKSDDSNVASMYRIKLVSDDGHLTELLVDTMSGTPVGIGGRGINGDADKEDWDD